MVEATTLGAILDSLERQDENAAIFVYPAVSITAKSSAATRGEIKGSGRPSSKDREDNGTTLAFVYFGIVASWASAKVIRQPHDEELAGVLDWLEERLIASTDNERNLIVVGFVEGLDTPRERGAAIRQMLPPQLRAAYDSVN